MMGLLVTVESCGHRVADDDFWELEFEEEGLGVTDMSEREGLGLVDSKADSVGG